MIRWFARNNIAANFLMLAILLGGLFTAYYRVPLEVRPSFEVERVDIDVTFRGATPDDIETVVAIPIERALEGIPGLREITSNISSGNCRIRLFAEDGQDLRELMDEAQNRVNSIPDLRSNSNIEPIRFKIPNSQSWWEVINVAVTGDLREEELVAAANKVRDDLVALPHISQANVVGGRNFEIAIEVNQERLRDLGLTLADLSTAIRESSIDLPAGTINTGNSSLMLRTRGQAYTQEEFEKIPVRAANGALVTIGEVANVTDGFEQNGKRVKFNGKPCLIVEVLRIGDESAIKIADTTKDYVEKTNSLLPDGIELVAFKDASISLRGRLSTLGWSLAQGGLLVLLVLGLFLRPKIALWVVIGIPVSFAGGLLLMPTFGVTANLMSIFGFIIVLGIVVDDAIVTGESIYTKLRDGQQPLDAAVNGTKAVTTPVTFGVLTTIVAFIPLMYMDDRIGRLARQIPPIVAPVLIFSLIESKLILPSHLKNLKVHRTGLNRLARFQKAIADSLETFVKKVYQPILDLTLRHRLTTLSAFLAAAMASVGLMQGDHMGFVSQPSIERYNIMAFLKMEKDTDFEVTDEKVQQLTRAAEQLKKEFRDKGTDRSLITNVLSSTGGWPGWGKSNPEFGVVAIEILPPSLRKSPGPRNSEIATRWRELVGEIPGSRQFNIRSQQSGSRGDDEESIEIELRGPDSPEKREITESITQLVKSYDGIESAWNESERQRDELQISLKPRAIELGLNQQNLARQVRRNFFGDQAQRLQRDRDSIRVMVRLPEKQRESLHTLDTLQITLPNGETAPFSSVAEAKQVQASSRIYRIDGQQAVDVNASPVDDEVDIINISKDLAPKIDELLANSPQLSWRYDGHIAEYEETRTRLIVSVVALLFTLYALLAIPFKSLIQPVFVLLAVPFGVIGALIGHLVLDITPSYFSVFGMLALSGVVVNDSLVMVDFINTKRREGMPLFEAVSTVGASRFRPIMLTSLTTFAGLLPLLFDNSIQAQFLIPMAASMAFGIVFATVITLFLIPAAYLASEDIKSSWSKMKKWYMRPFSKEA